MSNYTSPNQLAVMARTACMARDIEDVLTRMVVAARRSGHSWQEIGDALGISRQLAYHRYVRQTAPPQADP